MKPHISSSYSQRFWASVSGWEVHSSTRLRLARWAAVLALAIGLVPVAASAQEDSTITISGVFSMDYDYGISFDSPELFAVFANGYDNDYDHIWRLTLHGTTQSHYSNGSLYRTVIHATSFDLKFFGPDAATLNNVVSNELAGADTFVSLENNYDGNGGGFAIMQVGVGYPWIGNLYFFSGHDIYSGNDIGVDTHFPADADGYPVVGAEPFSIDPDYTELGYSELLSGWYTAIGSLAVPVTLAVIPATPTLSINRSNNVLVVSWPSSFTGFSLQQNDQLNTTNWVTSTEGVTDNGIIKSITVDPAMGNRYFRLFKP